MLTLTAVQSASEKSCRILGLDFFPGTLNDSIAAMKGGGLLVAPSAPGLLNLRTSAAYREALQEADVCLADSGFMVMIWNWVLGGTIARISGLAYLQRLLEESDFLKKGATFWIMSSRGSKDKNLLWLEKNQVSVSEENTFVAPFYGTIVQDAKLLEKLDKLRPKHIIVTLGGGTQEPLGLYLKKSLHYDPAIYCIGAAIAFLSGDQVKIPAWADRLYLGAFLRCASDPKQYVPRYWRAFKLLPLILRHRSEIPPLDP